MQMSEGQSKRVHVCGPAETRLTFSG